MATLRIVARFKSKDGKAEELRALLQGLIVPTRCEKGCIRYELLRNLDEPNEFTFVEEWEDENALGTHFETDHIRNALERFPDLLEGELDLRKYRLVD